MNDPAVPTKQSAPHIQRPVLRALIKQHGGSFHGPHVEHVHMEEQAFWRFMDQVIETAWERGRDAAKMEAAST